MPIPRTTLDSPGPLQFTLSIAIDDAACSRVAAALAAALVQAIGRATRLHSGGVAMTAGGRAQPGEAGDGPSQATQSLMLRGRQVAKLLGISEKTWWNLWNRGQAPAPARLGSIACWNPEEIRAWTAAGCPDQTTWTAMRKGK